MKTTKYNHETFLFILKELHNKSDDLKEKRYLNSKIEELEELEKFKDDINYKEKYNKVLLEIKENIFNSDNNEDYSDTDKRNENIKKFIYLFLIIFFIFYIKYYNII